MWNQYVGRLHGKGTRGIVLRGLAQARKAWFAAGFLAAICAPSGSGRPPLERPNRVPEKQVPLPPSIIE